MHYKFTHVDINQGLSHNQANCILKDRKGFLWVGTLSGLNRYDGYTVKVFRKDPKDSTSLHNNSVSKLFETPDGKIAVTAAFTMSLYNPQKENFETDLSVFYKQYSIPPGMVNNIVKDRSGNYWFIHASSGLIRYDAKEKSTTSVRHLNDSSTISSDIVTSLVEDDKGNYWMIHASGVLEYVAVDKFTHKVLYRTDYLKKRYPGASVEYHLQMDADGDLWLFAVNANQGAYYFNCTKKTFKHLHSDSPDAKLNVNIVRGIVQDNNGLIWIGTDHGGINVVDKKDFSVRYIFHREEDGKSLAQNSIVTLYKDDQGIIWVATYKKGISYYHENIIRFPLYKHYLSDNTSLPYEDVNRFVEDDQGNLWIGTNGGGLIYYDRRTETFKQYKNNPADPGSLSSDVIVSLCIDHEKKLWIGTYYGGLNSFDGKKFTRYNHDPKNPQSLADVSVWEIFEDSQHRLWIGTLTGGLDLFDRRTQTFSHYWGDLNSVQARYIATIMEDKQGDIWVGTNYGIDVLKRESGRFIHYGNEKNNPTSLSSNDVIDIREDTKGRIWIGTYGGLNLFDRSSRSFQSFTEADGLPHNSILTILEDSQGSIWMGTPNGISSMSIVSDSAGRINAKFKNFDEADGLQGKQYNENAAYRTSRGELIFGGANGFNIFKPEQLGMNKNKPEVIFSDFQLFNKSIKPDEEVDGNILLTESITEAPPLILPSGKNVFSLEFAALNFFHPEKNEYKYKLAGFNSDWLYADSKSRRVTFTNLDPGDYEFQVIAANNDGVWNTEGARIKIKVLPPFWKTKMAFILYVMAVITGLLITRKLIQQREQMKFAIQQERQEALRMHELDMMKIKFFTNVSHEFRTPLTLILTPLEKLLKQTQDEGQKGQFELIQRNAKRLLNLVNQLLDFRKMEVQEIRFHPSEGDVIKFIREVVYSFSDLSEKKDIALDFRSSMSSLETIFDQDKLEKILFNLLSNAFKFTPEHGSVSVEVELNDKDSEKWLQIKVIDTGIGISADKQERIFERFFQNELPKSMVNQGSGIGLSITREFVKIHGGSIGVDSE
ncbi:MAG TPA: two-component regulator propeller domain-containing protein, partial [Ohtaekwangia sp.]